MNDSRGMRLHYWMQAFIMIGFAFYIGYLVKSGSLHYYLAPRMEPWVKWCPILLGLMAVFAAYRAIAPAEDPVCDCEHTVPETLFKRAAIYGLFILPLAFGVLLPNRSLGSSAAAVKGFSLTLPTQDQHVRKSASSSAVSEAASENGSGVDPEADAQTKKKIFVAPDKYNEEFAALAGLLYAEPLIEVTPDIYSETIGAIELFKQDFIGKRISLSGFVYKDQTTQQSGGDFAVGRFLILCCTADALPFGVLVKASAQQVSLSKDSWVKVTGKINVEKVKGREVLRIDAERIERVAQPAVSYVYPSADSVAAFKKDLAKP
ncbi:TIGR03943 family putative permease subunit [Paenibacillus caui]|uniref:TIGR03943 family putative permease subunit n=1 Tax=Paenibacillus caui TaxID=2873927 RepID=UPI001CA8EE4A|nr:TIGR03943 family protein [Paenibacillus caui]